jgi:predicted alpha/beta superfamily hydrolase
MTLTLRSVALTLAWLVSGCVAFAQADAGAVTEIGRTERQVTLTLRSGPHPFAGDYPVTVFLPPGYDTATAAYPVLYIFDGYDIHAEHDALVQENLIRPAILVAITNKPPSGARTYDLTPTVSGANTGGLEVFAALITSQLKPYLDARFRTRPAAADTGIVGLSYGGLAACWLGYFHPDVFGLAAVLEPSLWWDNNRLLNRLLYDATPKFATRFWFMAADQNYYYMWQNAKQAAAALRQRGWREGEDIAFCQVHNYGHGWAGARLQLREMLHFLLGLAPAELVGVELTNCHGPQLVPLRPSELGGAAYAYLDLRFRYDLRTTAIAPELEVADPRVVSLTAPVLGQLVPAGSGWTTVSTSHGGFRAVVDVQGFAAGSSAQPPPRPAPPRIVEHPASQTVAPSGTAAFTVAATGAEDSSYQWRFQGQPLPAATGRTLTLDRLSPAQSGEYDVIVTNVSGGSTLSRTARLLVAPPEPGRLVNLSVRGTAGLDGLPLIIGFVVGGGSKCLLVRGVGPELAREYGVPGALADPRLDVHATVATQDRIVASNDNWSATAAEHDALAAAFLAVGAFPLPVASRDAALLLEVEGIRTVHASGVPTGTSGIILVETYDAGAGNTARLINVSARNRVGTGADILIAGFVLNGNVPKRLLVRGIGPGLSAYGVSDPLADPRLEVHTTVDGRDTVVAANDNWADDGVDALRSAFAASGAFDLPDAASRDAALLLTLPAGIYTALVSGVGDTTGNALVEIYEVP